MTEHAGFKLEHCRPHCPKAARNWSELFQQLESALITLNLQDTLEQRFSQILCHHIPKIALAGCPNGCSQPQIKDFSAVGYVVPQITSQPCTGCQACVRSCMEQALTWQDGSIKINFSLCLACGECIRACPSGTLEAGETGWQLHLGGRLGRHPRLAESAGKTGNDAEVVKWIRGILADYIKNGHFQERLSYFLERTGKVTLQINDRPAHGSNPEVCLNQGP